MIPEFMRFYHYSAGQTLNEYARVFFALANSMQEIVAKELLDSILVNYASNSKDGSHIIDSLEKQRKGLSAVIKEVKTAKELRKS